MRLFESKKLQHLTESLDSKSSSNLTDLINLLYAEISGDMKAVALAQGLSRDPSTVADSISKSSKISICGDNIISLLIENKTRDEGRQIFFVLMLNDFIDERSQGVFYYKNNKYRYSVEGKKIEIGV